MSSSLGRGALGATASPRMKKWRAATVALLVLAMVGSLLALAVPPPSVAGAQGEEPEGVTTETAFDMDCVGIAIGQRVGQQESLGMETTAPAQVEPDSTFTIRISPQQGFFPYEKDSGTALGIVRVFHLQNIELMYALPTNASLESVEIVPGSGYGIEGTPTVSINTTDYNPGRIVLEIPKIPGNPVEPTRDTYFQFPAIDVTVRATGPVGSNITTRVAGTNEATAGYVFQAASAALADVYCWPLGEVQAPAMSTTAIGSGGQSLPTTTELAVDPTILPGGGKATMTAAVNAPSGAVRFNDGATILGYAELNDASQATLTTQLNTVGSRSVTATYLGTAGFEPSTSAPVSVTVTNPANRDSVQVAVTASPARAQWSPGGLAGAVSAFTTIGATVSGPGGGDTPTGLVHLYDNGNLVRSGQLVDGAIQFAEVPVGTVQVPNAGHLMTVEYVGDVDYFPGSGTVPVTVNEDASDPVVGLSTDSPATGNITLNSAAAPVPGGSVVNSTYRTGPDGVQNLAGVLVFPSTTFATPSGSVTGQLAQIGTSSGSIAPSGEASLSTQLLLQVSAADFGSGVQQFGSTCWVGPFDVELSGGRAGTSGPMTLAAEGFSVPFAQAGSCIDQAGSSRATQVGAVLAGASTEITLEFTPTAQEVATEVVITSVTPDGGSSFGQPVTVNARYTLAGGGDIPASPFGAYLLNLETYSNGNFVATTGMIVNHFADGPIDISLTYPSQALTGGAPALPEGTTSLQVQVVSGPIARGLLATSSLSPSVPYTVLPELPKTPPTLTIDVPETAAAGATMHFQITLDPAPDDNEAPAPLEGTIEVFDDMNGLPIKMNGTGVDNFQDRIYVEADSDGLFEMKTALAPGEHQLRAVFTPDSERSSWWWGMASAEDEVTVVGEQIPTTLTIVSETTEGTGKVPQGSSLTLRILLDPVSAARPDEPFRSGTYSAFTPDLSGGFNSAGVLGGNTIIMNIPVPSEPGHYEARVFFDPSFRNAVSSPRRLGNQGYAPSEVVFPYEVVAAPGTGGPMATNTNMRQVQSSGSHILDVAQPSIQTQGTVWQRVLGAVSRPARGSVSFTARNLATGVVTALGSSNVTTGGNNQGEASLFQPAATTSLPAGNYEVRAAYTTNNPALYASSTSDWYAVQVVDPASPLGSEVELDAPATSQLGRGVVLRATASPAGATGTIEFLDGDTVIGSEPTVDGVASTVVFGLELGEHAISARFVPATPAVVGSTSDPTTHTVVVASIDTTTTLTANPIGSAVEGDEVTLTASLDPSDAPGSVEFLANGEALGTAEVIDGVATLLTDEIPVGNQELTAAYGPSDPEYGESVSEPLAYVIEAQGEGPIGTGTALVVSPEGSAALGSDVTLTATITPGSAVGTVSFLSDGEVVAGPVPVTDGQAQAVVDQLGVGTHELIAAFEPTDEEAFEGSASPAQSYEITADFDDPVFECQGTDDVSRGLMETIVSPPDGILELPVQLVASVPETLSNGGSGEVSFTWTAVLPENLANLAIEAQAAEIYMEDMTIAMVASGGSDEVWEFPTTHTIIDPAAPITLETSGTVTASAVEDIVYDLRSPLLITIHVPPTPLVFIDVYVNLSCEVHNATQAITQVQGGAVAPGAPTGVTAEAGPLMAHVSWTPPADDGGSPITGYVVTASPGGKTTQTSAEVTHVDVIGLEEGQNYTFTVQAVNEVGEGEASDPSNEVTPGPGENFSDVQPDHPFYAEIEWLAATGITTGMSPGFFGADLNLSRQAMAAFLYRLEGSPDGADPECTEMPFTDVSLDNAFCGEIQWLKDEGITQGNGDGTFNPTGNLSRQAMSAFLYRLANGPDTPPACTTSPYPDVPTSNVFCPQITWMGEVGITTTPPGDNFRPSDSLTRQAMAAFLYRYTTVIPTEL